MYAVIRAGGKQYRVMPGDTVKVERLAGRVGAKVTFTGEDVLAVSTEEKKLVSGEAAGAAKVVGKIVAQARHPKVQVMKFRKTKQYKILTGHRQNYTAISINDISL